MVHEQMEDAAANQQFERAAILRDQWQSIHKLMVEQKVVSTKREHADFLSLARLGNTAAVNVFIVRKGVLLHQEVFFLKHTQGQTDHDVLSAFADQYYAGGVPKPPRVYLNTETRRGRNRKLLELGVTNAVQALQRQHDEVEAREKRSLLGLKELGEAIGVDPAKLHRIETYDISHFQGKYKVGSMVVFIDGESKPAEYRKFKIKTVQGSNDFASLQEVLDRRLGHLPERARSREPWPVPDLLVIDGGKGQLSSVKAVMDALGVTIPVISLAKQEEEIFLPDQSESIRLPRESAGLHLIQHMRDEAHRFAIGFYRSRHLKDLV
jgi:excinuclease ABC subunit C